MNGDIALELDDVAITFNHGRANETKALQGVDLEVRTGDFVVVLGSNGAGKSTMMNAVAGVHYPDRGTIKLHGTDLTNEPAFRRAGRVGRVFQDPMAGTASSLTIEENLALAQRRGQRRRLRLPRAHTRHRESLARLEMGLEDRLDATVGMLSGGQRQAMSVLMAIEAGPELLLLDEHTAALDPGAAERVLQLTEELATESGVTTLMITHNMSHAVDLGNRTVMMHKGRVLFDVAGTERAELQVPDLVAKFQNLAHDTMSDRSVLA